MRTRRSAALLCLVAVPAASALRADVPEGYVEEIVARGVERPCAVAVASDGRVFVGEQHTGRIRILKDGKVLDQPFATLQPIWKGHNESGLVGLCLDPEFAKNGFVYVFATQTNEVQRVWRYTAKGDSAEGEPALFIDKIPTAGQNHDGGGIGFGPDGCFYVSNGESGLDQYQKEAQDKASWRGKILRFTRNGKIPADNPFGPASAIWCYGMRNTYRFAFQPATHRMFGVENGPDRNDEINVLVKGGNYGWPVVTGVAKRPEFIDPIHIGPKPPSFTGICFLTGDKLPAYKSDLFYTCHNSGEIWRLRLGGKNGLEVTQKEVFVSGAPNPVEVFNGPDGALWYTTLGGKIGRVFAEKKQ